MTTRAAAKSKNKKPLETTLGKAPLYSNDDPIDLSHVRKPIDTSIFGLKQVLTLFETATNEVRRYITYECDIMYECRMCRTIFRSLANFILHKRNYCRETYNHNDHTNCRNNCQENEFSVMQEDADVCIRNSRETSPIPPKCDSKSKQTTEVIQSSEFDCNKSEPKLKKNLKSVLSRLLSKQESTLITEQCVAEDLSDESKSSEQEEVKNNVALQSISDSDSGVFQTMFRNMMEEHSKMDLMKTEVMEIHDILENGEAILGSDGKIVTPDTEKSAVLRNNFVCTICNQYFSTKKTLTYHINYKHNNTRLVYRCTECVDTFANAWCVFRHLYKIHRKTPAQVKKLRSQIHANKTRRDEQPEQKDSTSSTTNPVQPIDLQGKMDLENQQWMDDLESDNDLQRCGGCGRKFERKAALHSHSQFCTKRIAVCNTIKGNSAKRIQTEEKLEKITKNSKITMTNSDNETSGSRRRKPLIAQKLCRVDYVKETNENCSDNNDEADYIATEKNAFNKFFEEYMVEKIQRKEDKIDDENCTTENSEVVNNSTKLKDTEVVTTFDLEQNIKVVNNGSSNCDGENMIDCCNDPKNVLDNANIEHIDTSITCTKSTKIYDSAKNSLLETTKNSIVTRSKSNIMSNLEQNSSSSKNNIILPDSFKSNNVIINHKTPVLESSDDLKITEVVEKEIQTESEDKQLESSLQEDSNMKIIIATSDENSSDVKSSSDTENAPQKNTIQMRCAYLENNHTTDGKRKINMFTENPEPENSKRPKTENTPKILNKDIKQISHENNSNLKSKISLESKCSKYINKEKRTCLPCNKVFKSYKSLIKHMALHFNWCRYQCSSCDFMSYNRSKCDRHAEKSHDIHDEAALKSFVLHIPPWKTLELSRNFSKHCRKHKNQNDKINNSKDILSIHPDKKLEADALQKETDPVDVKPVQKLDNPLNSVLTVVNDEKLSLPNTQDPSVRKMIMEVIFGSDIDFSKESDTKGSIEKQNAPECQQVVKDNSPEPKNEVQSGCDIQDPAEEPTATLKDNSRPVRNRTAPVQKDFLYDMKQILKPKAIKETLTEPAREITCVKKQKPLRVYVRKTKSAINKKSVQVTETIDDNSDVNKSASVDTETDTALEISQDINMNSKDVSKKHVTGEFANLCK